ncbi:hypothetical protein, partial [Thermus sp.]|uniref:hypothetical protein n=1 Tax=Thermus sp. TaxID=275 RepID=UPI0025D9FF42
MKPKAPSDLLARFRKTAEQPKPMAVAAPEVESPAPRAKPKMVRYTLDLEPAQHRFLKRFALEAGVDA